MQKHICSSVFLQPEETLKSTSIPNFLRDSAILKIVLCAAVQYDQILQDCVLTVHRAGSDHAGSTAGSGCQKKKNKKKPRGVSAAAPRCTFQNPKCAGCEATVSHGAPAHRSLCLAAALRRSVSVPHRGLFALQQLHRIRSGCQETFQPRMPVMGFYSLEVLAHSLA